MLSSDHMQAILRTLAADPEATLSARAVADVVLKMQADIRILQRRVQDLEIAEKRERAA